MEQLKCWRDKGYHVALDTVGSDRQWVLIIGTESPHDFAMRGYDLALMRQMVRFVSLPMDTIDECIKAAMEVIK